MHDHMFKPQVSEVHIYWGERHKEFVGKENLDYEFDEHSVEVSYREEGKTVRHVFTRATIDEVLLIEKDEDNETSDIGSELLRKALLDKEGT